MCSYHAFERDLHGEVFGREPLGIWIRFAVRTRLKATCQHLQVLYTAIVSVPRTKEREEGRDSRGTPKAHFLVYCDS